MTEHTTYVIYGVRIPDDANWEALREDPGECTNDGMVGLITAGRYDADMSFLAVRWDEIEPGQYRLYMPSDAEDDPRYGHWDTQLMRTALRLGLTVLDGPGWFTLPDES